MNFSSGAMRLLNEKCDTYAAHVRYLAQESMSTRAQHLLKEEEHRRRVALHAKHHAEEESARIAG